jgi:hypothetical protein
MPQGQFPPGWDEARVRKVLALYAQQPEGEAVAEGAAALEDQRHTVIEVPTELVPLIRELIARHQA